MDVTPNGEGSTLRRILEEGCATVGVMMGDAQLEAFETYYRELVNWNERANITALTDTSDVVIKHFVDSLTCVPVVDAHKCRTLVDVGTGGGFPGIPIKIARPDIDLTLVDSSGKRTQFLEHLVDALNAPCRIVKARAEEFGGPGPERQSYDAAVARALARLSVLLEYCLPLVRLGGIFIAMKGPGVEAEIEDARKALDTLGGEMERIHELELPRGAGGRALVMVRKVASTPPKYPRRAGVPERRPL